MALIILAIILLIGVVTFGAVVQKNSRWIALASALIAALFATVVAYVMELYWFSDSQ